MNLFGLDFYPERSWSNYGAKEACLSLCNHNRKRHCFPGTMSPGNGGTTGRTVENNPADERRQRRWGGRVRDTEGKQEWADGHPLDRERSGVVSKSVPLLICIFSLLPPRLDGSKGILSTRSVRNKACFYHWDQGFWVKVWFFQQQQQKYHRETLRREESWKVVYFWFMFSVTE